MKFALIFLSAFAVTTHQFYLQQPNVPMLWFSSPLQFTDNYHLPLLEDELIPSGSPIYYQNETPMLNIDPESLNNTGDFPDTQSRMRGFNRPSLNVNQGDRYLLRGIYNNNPFLRTLTTTWTTITTAVSTVYSTVTSTTYSISTSTSIITAFNSIFSTSTTTITTSLSLSLISVVKCVPTLQLSGVALNCTRKKRELDDEYSEDQQFVISPSGTFKLVPTALPSQENELEIPDDHLASSKEETDDAEHKRTKRFFFNRFQFSTLIATQTTTSTTTSVSTYVTTSVIVVPTTTTTQSVSTLTAFTTSIFTSYTFAYSSITQTVNLINPAPTVQCSAVALANVPQCVACLPLGYTSCQTAAG